MIVIKKRQKKKKKEKGKAGRRAYYLQISGFQDS